MRRVLRRVITFDSLRVAQLSSSSTLEGSYLQDDSFGEDPLEIPGLRGVVDTLRPLPSAVSFAGRLRGGKLHNRTIRSIFFEIVPHPLRQNGRYLAQGHEESKEQKWWHLYSCRYLQIHRRGSIAALVYRKWMDNALSFVAAV